MSETALPTELVESPAALTPETPAAAVEQETKPGLLERISASLQTKTGLLAEVATFRTRAETAEASLAEATADLTAARDELTTLRTERAAIAAQLATVEKETATAEVTAAKIVASIGVSTETLPEAAAELPPTKEQLVSRMEAEPDNRKRWELAKQINEMN